MFITLRLSLSLIAIVLVFNYCSGPNNFLNPTLKATSIDSIEVVSYVNADSVAPQFEIDLLKQPQPIKTKAPIYPPELRRAAIEGEVWVRMWITKTGAVRRATIIFSSDFKFNRSALLTAIEWKFSPAVDKNGVNRDVWIYLPMKYKIRS